MTPTLNYDNLNSYGDELVKQIKKLYSKNITGTSGSIWETPEENQRYVDNNGYDWYKVGASVPSSLSCVSYATLTPKAMISGDSSHSPMFYVGCWGGTLPYGQTGYDASLIAFYENGVKGSWSSCPFYTNSTNIFWDCLSVDGYSSPFVNYAPLVEASTSGIMIWYK